MKDRFSLSADQEEKHYQEQCYTPHLKSLWELRAEHINQLKDNECILKEGKVADSKN